jgi:transcriptional regulator with XRE-family HTH domain
MPIKKIYQGADQERMEFSNRLREALQKAHYAPDSPTQLAREFNLRHENRPITIHAARKWLVGESIPTQEKLRLLADWLRVSAEWLRFGGPEKGRKKGSKDEPQLRALNQTELAVMQNLLHLDKEQQDLMLKLVLNLIKANKALRPASSLRRTTK